MHSDFKAKLFIAEPSAGKSHYVCVKSLDLLKNFERVLIILPNKELCISMLNRIINLAIALNINLLPNDVITYYADNKKTKPENAKIIITVAAYLLDKGMTKQKYWISNVYTDRHIFVDEAFSVLMETLFKIHPLYYKIAANDRGLLYSPSNCMSHECYNCDKCKSTNLLAVMEEKNTHGILSFSKPAYGVSYKDILDKETKYIEISNGMLDKNQEDMCDKTLFKQYTFPLHLHTEKNYLNSVDILSEECNFQEVHESIIHKYIYMDINGKKTGTKTEYIPCIDKEGNEITEGIKTTEKDGSRLEQDHYANILLDIIENNSVQSHIVAYSHDHSYALRNAHDKICTMLKIKYNINDFNYKKYEDMLSETKDEIQKEKYKKILNDYITEYKKERSKIMPYKISHLCNEIYIRYYNISGFNEIKQKSKSITLLTAENSLDFEKVLADIFPDIEIIRDKFINKRPICDELVIVALPFKLTTPSDSNLLLNKITKITQEIFLTNEDKRVGKTLFFADNKKQSDFIYKLAEKNKLKIIELAEKNYFTGDIISDTSTLYSYNGSKESKGKNKGEICGIFGSFNSHKPIHAYPLVLTEEKLNSLINISINDTKNSTVQKFMRFMREPLDAKENIIKGEDNTYAIPRKMIIIDDCTIKVPGEDGKPFNMDISKEAAEILKRSCLNSINNGNIKTITITEDEHFHKTSLEFQIYDMYKKYEIEGALEIPRPQLDKFVKIGSCEYSNLVDLFEYNYIVNHYPNFIKFYGEQDFMELKYRNILDNCKIEYKDLDKRERYRKFNYNKKIKKIEMLSIELQKDFLEFFN